MDKLKLLENQKVVGQTLAVLPIPLNFGSDNAGMDIAYDYLVKAGLDQALIQTGFTLKTLPPASVNQTDNIFGSISQTVQEVKDTVKQEIQAGNKLLAVGGDHAISIGTIAGAAEAVSADLGVIWIDAHPDLHTPETSMSQAVHGMVSATLLGFGDPALTDIVRKQIKTENFLYVGLKDLDQAEIDFIRREKLLHFSMFDIVERGFAPIFQSIQKLQQKVGQVWVSFDVDSVDKEYAPGSAMATWGGLTYREVINLVTYIGKTCQVAGLDLVELTPATDQAGKTAALGLEVAAAIFGGKYNWYTAYMDKHGKK